MNLEKSLILNYNEADRALFRRAENSSIFPSCFDRVVFQGIKIEYWNNRFLAWRFEPDAQNLLSRSQANGRLNSCLDRDTILYFPGNEISFQRGLPIEAPDGFFRHRERS